MANDYKLHSWLDCRLTFSNGGVPSCALVWKKQGKTSLNLSSYFYVFPIEHFDVWIDTERKHKSVLKYNEKANVSGRNSGEETPNFSGILHSKQTGYSRRTGKQDYNWTISRVKSNLHVVSQSESACVFACKIFLKCSGICHVNESFFTFAA